MQRYFIDQQFEEGSPIIIDGENFHHIVRVMRMTVDSLFYVVFLNGESAKVKIETISSDCLEAGIVQWESDEKEMPVKITIASGLPKGDKLELIIQKGTELGAVEFVPFTADRSIVKWDEKKAKKKVERWEKIAKEAAEQSHRQHVPTVHSPVSLKEMAAFAGDYEYKIVAYEEDAKTGEQSNLAGVLNSAKPGDRILAVFGPEGGLTEKEVDTLKQNGFLSCGLGPRIMRAETAPFYLLSAASYQFELMR
ncbi:16S rRNA (uracil(1498)-N(3))-methyltransferase [Rossellomorea vietnamensis]|uniref:Ribosomal RNA small subunit methyltransferase E n=1 Tax=Rossellomorea vietnamensis TaxID=218284 RepID=A0A5D4MG06_9BACI|nr:MULTISPECIES: 16S rRNA (uracil(1498)-N(3))-methyltransferase [Bacillaceae]TYS00805.1 16S rRNA (uracil(1498)-N(3))-methyltransferase [Rossellomorea vietnamensis]